MWQACIWLPLTPHSFSLTALAFFYLFSPFMSFSFLALPTHRRKLDLLVLSLSSSKRRKERKRIKCEREIWWDCTVWERKEWQERSSNFSSFQKGKMKSVKHTQTRSKLNASDWKSLCIHIVYTRFSNECVILLSLSFSLWTLHLWLFTLFLSFNLSFTPEVSKLSGLIWRMSQSNDSHTQQTNSSTYTISILSSHTPCFSLFDIHNSHEEGINRTELFSFSHLVASFISPKICFPFCKTVCLRLSPMLLPNKSGNWFSCF